MKENDTNYWFFEASWWNALGSQSMIPLIYFKDFQELFEKSVAKAKLVVRDANTHYMF